MSDAISQELSFEEKFIDYLEKFVREENRAALAHLRRGLGRDNAIEMFPYVSGWTTNLSRRDENTYFLVASLVGLYPTNSWKPTEHIKLNNLGKSLSFLKDDSDSIERRFVALLNSDEEDLPHHLRQIISLLKSKNAPINWLRLLKDIRDWNSDKAFVQRNWAKGFWGDFSNENTNTGE